YHLLRVFADNVDLLNLMFVVFPKFRIVLVGILLPVVFLEAVYGHPVVKNQEATLDLYCVNSGQVEKRVLNVVNGDGCLEKSRSTLKFLFEFMNGKFNQYLVACGVFLVGGDFFEKVLNDKTG